MAKVTYDHICPECGMEFTSDERTYECPNCSNSRIDIFPMIECDCGERFAGGRFTNECPKCGALYNAFGQRLADPEEWDPDDRYGSFGPQNEEPW